MTICVRKIVAKVFLVLCNETILREIRNESGTHRKKVITRMKGLMWSWDRVDHRPPLPGCWTADYVEESQPS